MVVLRASNATDCAKRQRTSGLNWLRDDTSLSHSPDPHKVLSAMAAMAAYEKAGVLASGVFAATDHPLLFKLTLGAGIVWPLERFRHGLF